jgi:hypothetical protein
MTSSLPALFVLLATATEQPLAPQPARDRTIEIIITGPESDREKMEGTLRALLGNDPDVRWRKAEGLSSDDPAARGSFEAGERIWIDVAHPIQVRVYLSGCTSSGATNVRTVERPASDQAGLVERETVAQIVKAALQSLRGDRVPTSPICGASTEKEKVVLVANLPRRGAGAVWLGMGGGVGWGYVPAGNLEWESRIEVPAQAERVGLFHLLPEVGYMWSDDFALAVQARVEFIRQQEATYLDPSTAALVRASDYVTGAPDSRAYAAFLRAIWYRDLSKSGKLRLSLSGDLGGGVVRFPVAPVVTVVTTTTGDTQLDLQKTIARTDTRPMGVVLLGGSVGLLWHLTRHLAIALDGRVLSGLPAWGVVFEGQASAQVAFGGVSGPVVGAGPEGAAAR